MNISIVIIRKQEQQTVKLEFCCLRLKKIISYCQSKAISHLCNKTHNNMHLFSSNQNTKHRAYVVITEFNIF